MKAIVWTRYGPPEGLQKVEKPQPNEHEVLIRVHASTVTAGDCELRRLSPPLGLLLPLRLYTGLSKPEHIRILGQELSGEIEAVGQAVRRSKPAGTGCRGAPLGRKRSEKRERGADR